MGCSFNKTLNKQFTMLFRGTS